MQVMDAYISLIRAGKKLLTTEGTTIYLETTLETSILHRDGKHWEENKPSTRDDQIVARMKQYINHDLVTTKTQYVKTTNYKCSSNNI
jgi:hypothetical protein